MSQAPILIPEEPELAEGAETGADPPAAEAQTKADRAADVLNNPGVAVRLDVPTPEVSSTVGRLGGIEAATRVAELVDETSANVKERRSKAPIARIRADVEDLIRNFDDALERLREEDEKVKA
jgi:hypothetical protein